jgi:hypothetical protein
VPPARTDIDGSSAAYAPAAPPLLEQPSQQSSGLAGADGAAAKPPKLQATPRAGQRGGAGQQASGLAGADSAAAKPPKLSAAPKRTGNLVEALAVLNAAADAHQAAARRAKCPCNRRFHTVSKRQPPQPRLPRIACCFHCNKWRPAVGLAVCGHGEQCEPCTLAFQTCAICHAKVDGFEPSYW